MELELHPLCTYFPRLDGNEFDLLRNDIKEKGLNNPIVIYDGMILDGGNRYKACIEAGVEPKFIEFNGENISDFVMSVNFHRRHLSAGQRAAIVSGMQDWTKSHPPHRDTKEGCNVAPLSTVSDRASTSGASRRTQQKADKLTKVDPDLAKKVCQGKVTLAKAIKTIAPQKDHDQQEPEYTELDKLNDDLLCARDEIRNLVNENTKLKDALATGQLPEAEIVSAEQIIIDLRKQVKNLELELDAVKSSRDIYQRENAELKSQCLSQQRKLKKLGAANASA